MEDKRLTELQKRFIDYYIETGSALEAAQKAGYSAKTAKQIGSQNLSKLDREIKVKMKAKDSERIASQDEVLRFYTAVLRNEIVEDIPLLAGDGLQRIAEKGISAKDRLKAAELLGKRYGIDKASGDGVETVRIVLERKEN